MFKTKSVCMLAICASTVAVSSTVYAKPNEALIASLIRGGNAQAAYLELANSSPTRADLLFFRALILQNLGQFDEAISLLSEALIENPNHLNARRELASTLFLQKKYRLAEQSFQELIEIDGTPEMQSVYLGFINRIRAQQPFGISGHFSILPSSNVNRGTENLIFDSRIGDFVINPESQAVSGIGLQAGVFGFYRTAPNSKSQNIISWGLNGTAYEASVYNAATATLRFTHETLLSDVTKISFGVHSRYTWREDDADNGAIGVSFALLHALSPKNRLSFGVNYDQIEYFHQPHNTGPLANVSIGYTHQESPSLSYSIGTNISWRDTNVEHAAYTGFGINAGVKKEWTGGYITGISLNAGFRDYEGDFPLAGEARKDVYYGLSLSIQNNNWNFKGFVPRASCSYTHNQSNIEFYQYDVSECNISFNKRF